MYGLFCGFKSGGPVAEFAKNRMAFEVFGDQDPITKDMDSDQVSTAFLYREYDIIGHFSDCNPIE